MLVKKNFFKFLIIIIFSFSLFPTMLIGKKIKETMEDALRHYQFSEFDKAKAIALQNKDNPLAQLIIAYCELFDKENKDQKGGMEKLKKLYENKNLLKDKRIGRTVWAEATISYANLVFNFQERELYKEYMKIDTEKIYKEVMKNFPNTIYAVLAARGIAEKDLKSPNNGIKAKGANFLENFIQNYKGPQKDLIMLHFMLDGYYINIKKNYVKSFEHIKRAYEIGITKGVSKEDVLFRMARICHKKLNNYSLAKKYYKEFLKLYPYADRAPLAKKYLKQLQ